MRRNNTYLLKNHTKALVHRPKKHSQHQGQVYSSLHTLAFAVSNTALSQVKYASLHTLYPATHLMTPMFIYDTHLSKKDM